LGSDRPPVGLASGPFALGGGAQAEMSSATSAEASANLGELRKNMAHSG
jgi:hypothetical protein